MEDNLHYVVRMVKPLDLTLQMTEISLNYILPIVYEPVHSAIIQLRLLMIKILLF